MTPGNTESRLANHRVPGGTPLVICLRRLVQYDGYFTQLSLTLLTRVTSLSKVHSD